MDTEREVARVFWIERFQKTQDISYRNKVWEHSKELCYMIMNRYSQYNIGHTGDQWFMEYEVYMKEAFERAIRSYNKERRESMRWFTFLGWHIRSKMSNCKKHLLIELDKYHLEMDGILGTQVQEDYRVAFTDPRDYAEEAIWTCDTRDFRSSLDKKDQSLVDAILEGETVSDMAKKWHSNTNDIKKRCLKIGKLYEEYMSG